MWCTRSVFFCSSEATRAASFCSRDLRDGDLLGLLRLGLGAALLEPEDRLVGVQVLAAHLHALLLAELVRLHVVLDGDLGDLPDAVGVHDVVVIERLERRLLEVVDGGVVEDEAVQVLADDLDDLVLEVVALRVELVEVEVLADGLERLGELRREELLEGLRVAGAGAADRLRDLEHVVARLVHAHEEGDVDVGADVVVADEAFLAAAVDVDRLHGEVHRSRRG